MKRFPLFGLLVLAFLSIGVGAIKMMTWSRSRGLYHLTAADWQSVLACAESVSSRCTYSESVEALLRVDIFPMGQGAVAGLAILTAIVVCHLAKASTRSYILLLVVLLAFALATQFAHLQSVELADHFVRSGLASVKQDCSNGRATETCGDYMARMQGIRYGAMILSKVGFALLAAAAVALSAVLALALGAENTRISM